ncbi:endonuclease/exonuclease/phosphatase family protein [Thermoleptolyngbya sichuanensis A183]|uniref:Endonuclease/exonuclease/phosphatase family protein n=1 Tax=Thermoleptolyngbya sichuanensis A183 TaxID=2737172 RepID=A0A6M8BME1_9CYAN|nr:endonuclease/exonuclease/phosphatase family protein [Thermoleptolyngbya sichuanensis A183]
MLSRLLSTVRTNIIRTNIKVSALHQAARLGIAACFSLGVLQSSAGAAPIRFASFNAYLNREAEGQLLADLATPDNPQVRAVAEIIQRVNPDVLLLLEFDYDPTGEAVRRFQENYLAVGHNGAAPIHFPYVYLAPSNTGIPSGFDLDNDGQVSTTPGTRAYGGDAFGFGLFPGQYGMVLLSKYPIIQEQVRTFQMFLWKDMPGALLPSNPATPNAGDWYSPEELAVLRLSSKNHWDVPILIGDSRSDPGGSRTIHVLASHPTPPVFDGPEDRNGRRNHDELRLWADYITPGRADYLYDDRRQRGGLSDTASFVIMGDLNADPIDGDGMPGAIAQLLDHPRVNADLTPSSAGGQAIAAASTATGPTRFHTASFGRQSLRLDYVLPSTDLRVVGAGVFWPAPGDPLFRLVGDGDPIISSDHRLVWVDVEI